MHIEIVKILFLFLFFSSFILSDSEPLVCPGNRFKFLSSYALGRQNDLTLTFTKLLPMVHVDKVSYSDEVFRTYTIEPLKLTFSYMQSRQIPQFERVNVLKITGGLLRISYEFKWQKKQLGSSVNGTGRGSVTTDPLTFDKKLEINQKDELQWFFNSADPITISNSLTLSAISPYKKADSDIINQMLNVLPHNDTTVKKNLIEAINLNYTSVLKTVIQENNDTWKEDKYFQYRFSDYHGEFIAGYDNLLVDVGIEKEKLGILLSTTIQNDQDFECGEKVPSEPDDVKVFGGVQEFISNSFLKSTLINALKEEKFLDVLMTQPYWQCQAFQFCVGDLHEVMPSTRNISTEEPITGRCQALPDSFFSLEKKSLKTYELKVNYTCAFEFKQAAFLGMQIPMYYEITPEVKTDHIDFQITNIKGEPEFQQKEGYQIKNMDLALFMIEQTLKTSLNLPVLGSGFKTMIRKSANYMVRDSYLFLYDSSAKVQNKLNEL